MCIIEDAKITKGGKGPVGSSVNYHDAKDGEWEVQSELVPIKK